MQMLDPLGVELARRWLAALALAPASERARIVKAVERQIAHDYNGGSSNNGKEP